MMCRSPIPKAHWHQTRIIDVHGRQKSTAGLKSLDQGAVLARLSVPITQKTAELIEDMRSHHDYAAGSARQGPGSWGWIWRVLPAHQIYWIPQIMMLWSPIPIALWCNWPVVQFCHDGRQHTEGPAGCDYECRVCKHSGLHLFFILPVSDAYAWFITPDRPWIYHSRPASNIASVLR